MALPGVRRAPYDAARRLAAYGRSAIPYLTGRAFRDGITDLWGQPAALTLAVLETYQVEEVAELRTLLLGGVDSDGIRSSRHATADMLAMTDEEIARGPKRAVPAADSPEAIAEQARAEAMYAPAGPRA